MSLGKVGKEKDELGDLNSWFNCCINDLKVSVSALKETVIAYNLNGETAEN